MKLKDKAQTVKPVTLKEQIETLRNEAINLPADVSFGYTCNRPELLRIVNRPMDEKEVKAVLDALAGQMQLNDLYKQRVAELSQLIVDIGLSLRELREASEKLNGIWHDHLHENQP